MAFGFDGLGRQTQAGPVSYTYDGLDRLAARTATAPLSSATSTLSYAGALTDPSTNGESSYARSAGGTLLAAREGGGDPALASLNRHGDLAALVDGTGALVASRVYEPFGVVAGSGGTANPGVGYQGDVTDPDTGDVWMGARWYDPADAQFTARDTVLGQLATPVTLNRYTYANGNPLTFHDPTGRCSEYSEAAILAEQDDVAQLVMVNTRVRQCAAYVSEGITQAVDDAVSFVWDTVTAASDVVECVQGDAASCGMAALNVIPGGRAAKAISQTLVRFKRSVKAVKQVKKQLNRVQTAARSAMSRIKHGPDVPPTAKTPAHVPNASNARKAPNAPQSPGARQAAAPEAAPTPGLQRGKPTGGYGPVDGTAKVDVPETPRLDWRRAKVNQRGVEAVEQHLQRFAGDGPLAKREQAMVDRLRAVSNGTIYPTHYDLRFYTHELRESVCYRKAGYPVGVPGDEDVAHDLWDELHTKSLADYGMSRRDGLTKLYDPSVGPPE